MNGSLAPTQSLPAKPRRKSPKSLPERLSTMSSTQPWVSADPHTIFLFPFPKCSFWRDYNVYYISTGRFHKKKVPSTWFQTPVWYRGRDRKEKIWTEMRMWTKEGFRSTVELNSYRIFFCCCFARMEWSKKNGKTFEKKQTETSFYMAFSY